MAEVEAIDLTEVAVDTSSANSGERLQRPEDNIPVQSLTPLYESPRDALAAVHRDYLYWTERLTENSRELSYALLAANWMVFGSLDKILNNDLAKISVTLVLIGLAINLLTAKLLGELHQKRVDYAEENPARWEQEFKETTGKRIAWPFTSQIESIAKQARIAKLWLPLASGLAFVIALIVA